MEGDRLGIDVGGTKILYGLLDSECNVKARMRTQMPKDVTPEQLTDKIDTEARSFLQENGVDPSQLRGIGIGMPSYVDFERGIVVSSGSIDRIQNYPARDLFRERFPGVEVLVDNDTNLAALAEHRMGAGRGSRHMVYTALSTGIGSGFIINGELFRGSYGGAGESGHMLVTPGEGVMCGCGNKGCIMSYASGVMIMKHVRRAIESGEPSVMREMTQDLEELNSHHLAKAWAMGDALAVKMMDQMTHYIAVYIYNLFMSFNIGCYVCGGGLTNMGEPFMEEIRRKVAGFNHQSGQNIDIRVAQLGGDNGIIGAAMLFE
ncbi:ROK family protein [uncultured Ruthenibacterium sp.]|uniref:ROK family protein n=1 Tax=uncultured Ruthenibacterium sp. TaxID=1905347 RepID=UPI00349ED9BF